MKQASSIADKLYSLGYRFISGKFFVGNREIKNIKKYLWHLTWLKPLMKTVQDTKDIVDVFEEMYGEDSMWPVLQIIEDAKNISEEDYNKPLAYPLTDKLLKIFNRMLDPKDDHFFILCGVGGSGKSTAIDILKQIFENDFASITMDELGEDFKLAEGASKRLVCSDELNANDFNNGVIKTLCSRQPITINPKYEKPYQARWQARMIYCCNKPPRLDIEDTGVGRRICYYFMNTKIENPNPDFKDKVYTYEELVNIVAHALRMDMTNWFDDFKKETHELLREGSSVWICKLPCGLQDTDYPDYVDQCHKRGMKPFSQPKWDSIKTVILEWIKEEMLDELPF